MSTKSLLNGALANHAMKINKIKKNSAVRNAWCAGVFACVGVVDVAHAADIDRVVVFADRAEVTRKSDARCSGGTASVTFAGLPDAVDARTLRGEVEGDAVVVGVSTSTTPLTQELNEQTQALQNEITATADEIDVLDGESADENERLMTWQSYGAWARGLIAEDLRNPKPDVARWEQLLTTLTQETLATSTKGIERAAKVRVLNRRLERLGGRLARLNPSAAPKNTVATVAVQCGASSTPTVRLAYVVPAASWSPEYDLRFVGPSGPAKVGEGKATLTVGGVVRQSSGEDWENVEVWLSTAKPRLGGEAPLPNPIYVYGQPEEKQKTLVEAQENRAADLAAAQGGERGAQSASLDDGGKAFVLKLARRVTVRADGRPYWFPVDEVTTKATSSLVAVPNLSPWVFQAVAWNNPAAYPLMAGKVHMFRGATFVGDVALEYRAPGEAIELSLGVDEEIALERKDLLAQKREAGFFSGSQTVAQAYRTILHNRSNSDVVVEIREQIPVTKTADIKVTVEKDKTTAGYSLDELRGHLKWKVALKKGATDKRDIGFTIALPKEWALP
jgi:uncharacterized protein (TIGR02231 family)